MQHRKIVLTLQLSIIAFLFVLYFITLGGGVFEDDYWRKNITMNDEPAKYGEGQDEDFTDSFSRIIDRFVSFFPGYHSSSQDIFPIDNALIFETIIHLCVYFTCISFLYHIIG